MDELVTKADVDLVVGRVATLTATNDQLQAELDRTVEALFLLAGSVTALIVTVALISYQLEKLSKA